MIRRNHIDTQCRIDRYSLKYQPRSSIDENRNIDKYAFKSQNMNIDQEYQNAKLTSANKKYHQYKDMKENKNQNCREEGKERRMSINGGGEGYEVQRQRQRQREKENGRGYQRGSNKYGEEVTMKEGLNFNYNLKQQRKIITQIPLPNNNEMTSTETLKRQYKYEIDNLKMDYNQNKSKKNTILTLNTLNNEDKKSQKQYNLDRNRLHSKANNDHNNRISQTPSRKSFQSTQKYEPSNKYQNGLSSGSKSFTPLFQDGEPFVQHKYLTSFPQQNQNNPSNNNIHNLYKPITFNKMAQKRSQTMNLPFTTYIQKQKNIQHNNFLPKGGRNYNQKSQQPPSVSNSTSTSLHYGNNHPYPPNNTNQQNLQKQQLSSKLKMISSFNDQINQRIKNIISCFEGLKNKY